MHDNGVTAALATLVEFDPTVADRDELSSHWAQLRAIKGWVATAELTFARRSRQLADRGKGESVVSMLAEHGNLSNREAKTTREREQVCASMPGFEHALASGSVGTGHVDSLRSVTRNMSDAERADLIAAADELVTAATNCTVDSFDRHVRHVAATIREQHRADSAAAELERQRAQSKITRWVDRVTGIHKTLIELDPERDSTLWTALGSHTSKLLPTRQGVAYSQVQIEALLTAINSTGTDRAAVPEISVLVDYRTLVDGLHTHSVCETDNGTPLPVSTVRRLCCDAEIIPIVLGGHSEALDVGRTQRSATRAQRRALRAMYRTCAHPGCTIGFPDCKIHHITWWRFGGNTNLTNLAPLCENHHHLVHEGGWTLTTSNNHTHTWTRPDGTTWKHTPPPTRAQPDARGSPTETVAG